MRLQGNLRADLGRFQLATGDFDIALDGVTVVFGASGAGKSSFLHAVAGLLPQARGCLQLNDDIWNAPDQCLPAHQRGVGMVFQDAALFPHLSVLGNLQYARRRSKMSQQQLTTIATQVGLQQLLDKPVSQLSGGQKQRAALARALLGKPRLLCLDEPLSAVDWPARHSLLALIESLAADSQIPILYVTHSAMEAERLGRRIVFMRDGEIDAVQSLQDTLAQADSPLFEQDGAASVLIGRSDDCDRNGIVRFSTQAGVQLRLLATTGRQSGRRLRIRARDISLARKKPEEISILNQLPVNLLQLRFISGGRAVATLQLQGGETLLAEITQMSAQQLQLQAGDQLFALVKSVALMD